MSFMSHLDIMVSRVDHAAQRAVAQCRDSHERWYTIRNAAYKALYRQGVPKDHAFNIACRYSLGTWEFAEYRANWEGAYVALGEELISLVMWGAIRI